MDRQPAPEGVAAARAAAIPFDEKMRGTVHLAPGLSFPQTGAQNKSVIHLDMLCDMRKGGEIHGDGECFYRDGKWLIPG